MTFPVQFHAWGFTLEAHQVLEVLAYGLGFQCYLLLRRRWPRGPAMTVEQTAWVVLGAIFGALIGAKLLAWLESFPLYWEHRHDWRVWVGGKTIVGALLGGWAGVTLAKRHVDVRHPTGDVYVFPVILGMCIGRIGCFLAGLSDHTFGIASSLPWAVDFGDGIPRHPTQLYEIGFLLSVAGLFAWRIRTRRQCGCMFSQFVLAYAGFRFAVEFLKPRYTLPVIPLSAIQLTCLAAILYAARHWNSHCCGRMDDERSAPARSLAPDPATHQARGLDGCGRPNLGTPAVVELTNSLCPACLQKVEAKVVIDDGRVYLNKFCPEHGSQQTLIADDAAYWQRCRSLYSHPPTAPPQRQTEMRRGCPWDCGLCPDHDQHTCLAVLEITDQCNLNCPICYATSHAQGRHRTLAEIEPMLGAVARRSERVGVLQISGGEPTLHPQLFEILDRARAHSIRHVMLNTNGLRIAEDDAFVRRLSRYQPGFEVYLQFDSLEPGSLTRLRGSDVSGVRRRALERLNCHDVSTTLVVTLQKGVNDGEVGQILEFAVGQKCVRGVTFQPVQAAGRLVGFDAAADRLTLTEVRRAILGQSRLFQPEDVVPVPCHPDMLAAAYAIRRGQTVIPLSRWVDTEALLSRGGNTICYEQDPGLRQHLQQSLRAPPEQMARRLKLQCCLPLFPATGSPIAYRDVFRVLITQFMDAHSMDLRSVKRSCVHIVTPDGRLVPFETYNLLHRPRPGKPQPQPKEPSYVS